MAIRRAPRRRIVSSSRSSSSVSPLYDSATTTSSAWMTPRSPWMASAGCRKNAGVPVLDERRRDLPADDARLAHAGERCTRPRHSASSSTARSKRSSRRSTSAEDGVGLGLEDLPGQVEFGAGRRWSSCVTSLPLAAGAARRLRRRRRSRMQPVEQGVGSGVEAERVLRVAPRARRVLVHLEEDAVHAGRDAGRRERLDVLGQARR